MQKLHTFIEISIFKNNFTFLILFFLGVITQSAILRDFLCARAPFLHENENSSETLIQPLPQQQQHGEYHLEGEEKEGKNISSSPHQYDGNIQIINCEHHHDDAVVGNDDVEDMTKWNQNGLCQRHARATNLVVVSKEVMKHVAVKQRKCCGYASAAVQRAVDRLAYLYQQMEKGGHRK